MSSEIDRTDLQRVIAVINGKGGVGKTTLTANIGGLLAASGWKVLLVDLDLQGNLGLDLGYTGSAIDDDGRALSTVIGDSAQMPIPAREVRPNLDVLVGGPKLAAAAAGIVAHMMDERAGDARLTIAMMLTKVAGDYDIVLIDCPPGEETLQSGAVAAARYVLIPAKTDEGSLLGLKITADRLDSVLDLNPELDLLGVVIFGSGASAHKVREEFTAQVTERLGGVGAEGMVFKSYIRHAEATANSARAKGLLVHELDSKVRMSPKWYERLKKGLPQERVGPASAGTVADSLQAVTEELIQRIMLKESEAEAANNV